MARGDPKRGQGRQKDEGQRHFLTQHKETATDFRQDFHWLLRERQINVSENETFVHWAYRIGSVAGVENGANLSVEFDPSCQSLSFHWVRLWRGGNHIEQLDRSKIRIIQREQDLENLIYSGTKSALIVLEDVRVGDIVDCAWSIKGANPVYSGRGFAAIEVQGDNSVEHLVSRVLWPVKKRLFIKNHGSVPRPIIMRQNETLEYLWDLNAVQGVALEDRTPPWFEALPWVQMSEFGSWAEVNQWALGLFQNTAALSPELLGRIAQWRKLPDREEQVLSALRFLQDEVRYFGVEIGASSVCPATPSTVFARRYGDCKDKALLFVAILRALGVESYPVLVNTAQCRAIESWQPSAGIFDHAIVKVRLADRIYWLDPTATYQRGALAAHYLPDYGCGLVVGPRTQTLESIPASTVVSQTHVTESFLVRNVGAAADLKVVTIAEGLDADGLRSYLATTKTAEAQKDRIQAYTSLYPAIKTTAPRVVTDDEGCNRIEITEFYTIPGFWTQSEKDKRYRCQFYPGLIGAQLRSPRDTLRTMPLKVGYPKHLVVRTEVALPGPWPLDQEVKTISDGAFYFHKDYQCQGNRLILQNEYRSVSGVVSPERIGEYLEHLNAASDALGYPLATL